MVTPTKVYPQQDAILAVHWHPEFIPLELVAQRIAATFPNSKKRLLIPTQHNEIVTFEDYSGVEMDCYSKGFNQKIQLLLHFPKDALNKGDRLKSMLLHTFMIVEYLSGHTFEEIILNSDEAVFDTCVLQLMNTMGKIWHQTRRFGLFGTDYMTQLGKRLDSVRQVHPTYHQSEKSLGSLNILSSDRLIEGCKTLEATISAPCHVFIHGDFNVNNIFYDAQPKSVRYIDLHRSRFADYVQDASVFLVSNYRLPFFDNRVRTRLNGVIEHFMDFFKAFSVEINDAFFEVRMALAVARSFYTSTRFELNPRFSRSMFLSAHFLMEKLVSHHEPWEEFTMPRKVLFY